MSDADQNSLSPDTDQDDLVPNPAAPQDWLIVKYCANGALSVDTVDSALYDEQVHGAIGEATTLGEFWLLLPQPERDELSDFFFDALSAARFDREGGEDALPDDWQDRVLDDCYSPAYWATDRTPFEPDRIPGFSDGDYPRWQQQVLDEVLPEDLLLQFATEKHSVHNGPYWHIPHESAPALINALRRRGFHVDEASFLRGW